MAVAPIKRMRQCWFWILAPLVLGFVTPSLVIVALEVFGRGALTTSEAFRDVMERQFAEGATARQMMQRGAERPVGSFWGERQFAEGDKLFLLAVWNLIPFVVLSGVLLLLPATFSRRRIACLSIFGLLGAGIGHSDSWRPLFGASGEGPMERVPWSVIVFEPRLFMCLVTMFVGFGVGWLVCKLSWFQPPRSSADGT